jgi:hypothetical protein
MEDLPLVAAGREIPHALDRIRRYCGLPWSGGQPETWAWQFYDVLEAGDPTHVSRTDVLAAAALHPGLSRDDLAYFHEQTAHVDRWVASLPTDLMLADAPDEIVEHLVALPAALPGPSLTLLTKVLHRKRPHLVPLLDRHIIDWYRPLTGQRAVTSAWGPVLLAMRDDLSRHEAGRTLTATVSIIERELASRLSDGRHLTMSWLRAIDIAVWMGSR